MTPINTARLTLVPWRPEHVELLTYLASIREMMTYVGDGQPWSREKCEDVSASAKLHWHHHGFGRRAAIERATGVQIGLFRLNFAGEGPVPDASRDFEIGWWVHPNFWRRGYAREGAAAMRDEAFQTLRATSIFSRIQPANAPSIAVARALGLRHHFDTEDALAGWISIYGLSAADWMSQSCPRESSTVSDQRCTPVRTGYRG